MAVFFPGGLKEYIALWPLGGAGASQARITATVVEGLGGALLRGVYSPDLVALKAGTYENLTSALDVGTRGFFASEWAAISTSAEAYVAIVVEGAPDPDGLVVALAEVQIR